LIIAFAFGARKIKLNLIMPPKKKEGKTGKKRERKRSAPEEKERLNFYKFHQSYFNLSLDFPTFL
jgi:hypothetical protein